MQRIGFRTMMLGALALVNVAAPVVARDSFIAPDGAGAKVTDRYAPRIGFVADVE